MIDLNWGIFLVNFHSIFKTEATGNSFTNLLFALLKNPEAERKRERERERERDREKERVLKKERKREGGRHRRSLP